VAAFRVVRASGVRSRLDVAAAAGLTPLVGREQELGLLLDRWDPVREGTGQAVVIAGEAGIGKSRLVEAFRERLAETPHTWLECRCSPYTQDSALFPVIDLLHQALAVARDASRAEKLAQLEGALRFAGFELAEAMPLLTSFLSLPLPRATRCRT
jgi:predicted ATPase